MNGRHRLNATVDHAETYGCIATSRSSSSSSSIGCSSCYCPYLQRS